MNTVIVPMPVKSGPPAPPPKCPHCREDLQGWSKPDDVSTGQAFIYTMIVLLIIAGLIAGAMGAISGAMGDRYCRDWPSKKGDVLFPTYGLGCKIGLWGSEGL